MALVVPFSQGKWPWFRLRIYNKLSRIQVGYGSQVPTDGSGAEVGYPDPVARAAGRVKSLHWFRGEITPATHKGRPFMGVITPFIYSWILGPSCILFAWIMTDDLAIPKYYQTWFEPKPSLIEPEQQMAKSNHLNCSLGGDFKYIFKCSPRSLGK